MQAYNFIFGDMIPENGEQRLIKDLSNLRPGGHIKISSFYRVKKERQDPSVLVLEVQKTRCGHPRY